MLIKVTQEHISKGEILNCNRCPISLAIIDSDHKIAAAHVSGYEVILYAANEKAACRKLPPAVKQFVYKFDIGKSVEPFEFELEGF